MLLDDGMEEASWEVYGMFVVLAAVAVFPKICSLSFQDHAVGLPSPLPPPFPLPRR